MKRALLLSTLAFGFGCATLPPPVSLTRARAAADNPATQSAAELAPQAYANAQALRSAAAAAYDDGDMADAEILGEHAVAAYSRTVAQARTVRAERRLAESRTELGTSETALIELDALQARVGSEADLVETRVRVARDTEPLAANQKTTPGREHARWQAAASMATDAGLACSAAQLLGDKSDELSKVLTSIRALDEELTKHRGAAPIDKALTLRSDCLRLLTQVRRTKSLSEPTSTVTDSLLRQLGKAGLSPTRDERGVVVTLHNVFDAQGKLQDAEQLAALGRIGREHPDFPILVVAHRARGEITGRDRAQGEAIAKALREAGAKQGVEVVTAGTRRPLLPRTAAGARAANERVEIVFVSPTW